MKALAICLTKLSTSSPEEISVLAMYSYCISCQKIVQLPHMLPHSIFGRITNIRSIKFYAGCHRRGCSFQRVSRDAEGTNLQYRPCLTLSLTFLLVLTSHGPLIGNSNPFSCSFLLSLRLTSNRRWSTRVAACVHIAKALVFIVRR